MFIEKGYRLSVILPLNNEGVIARWEGGGAEKVLDACRFYVWQQVIQDGAFCVLLLYHSG